MKVYPNGDAGNRMRKRDGLPAMPPPGPNADMMARGAKKSPVAPMARQYMAAARRKAAPPRAGGY